MHARLGTSECCRGVSTHAHWPSTRDTSTVTTAIVHAADASRIIGFGSPHANAVEKANRGVLWLGTRSSENVK
jgi:hypothetical protein